MEEWQLLKQLINEGISYRFMQSIGYLTKIIVNALNWKKEIERHGNKKGEPQIERTDL